MPMSSGRRVASSWIWIAALWAGLGILDATQNVFSMRQMGMHHSWVKMFIVLTIDWLPWALLTPLVIYLGRRFPPHWKSPRTWLPHLGAIVAIELAVSAWSMALDLALQPWLPDFHAHPFLANWTLKFAGGLLPAIILYSFINAVMYALDSKAQAAAQRTDTARLNEQLSYARLNALQRQIEPHFLFNTLNSISGLVREQRTDAAVTMIVALSELLRRTAGNSHESQVSLASEIEFLRKYLEIQEARFAGRLKLELDIPKELLAAQIPNLLLQPLVENALKHGIAQRVQGGAVRIAAARADGMLQLRVYNDGPLLNGDRHAVREGTGLSNLRTRLTLLHGENCELRLDNYGITGVEACVALPYREA